MFSPFSPLPVCISDELSPCLSLSLALSLSLSLSVNGRCEPCVRQPHRKGSVVNVNPTNIRPQSDAPEIRKYKKKFNAEILCASLWGETPSHIITAQSTDINKDHLHLPAENQEIKAIRNELDTSQLLNLLNKEALMHALFDYYRMQLK